MTNKVWEAINGSQVLHKRNQRDRTLGRTFVASASRKLIVVLGRFTRAVARGSARDVVVGAFATVVACVAAVVAFATVVVAFATVVVCFTTVAVLPSSSDEGGPVDIPFLTFA
jgi:hypothetical protein